MPTMRAVDAAKKYPDASAVEIKNMASKVGADVDWSGWSEPARSGLDLQGGPPLGEAGNAQRTRNMERTAAGFTPRGVAAGAANLLPPVVGALAGAGTMLATKNLPATMAAEGAGNALGEKARIEAMRGLGLPTPEDERGSIITQGVLGAAAPGVARVAGMVAPNLYRGAINAGVKETGDAIKTGSRLAGRGMQANEVDLAAQGMRERVPIGPGFGGTGMDRLDKLDAPHNAAIDDAISRLDASGHKATIADLAQKRIAALRAKVAKGSGGAQDAAQIDQWTNDLAAQWSDASGNMKPLSASEVQEQKVIWQKQAEAFYKTKSADPNQKLRAQFDAAIASGAREHLENQGAAGRVMKKANAALSSRKPLREAVGKAEIRRAAGKSSGGSLITRVAAPGVGATAGLAFGGGGQGAAGGALAASLLERYLADPANASRLALFLTEPPVQATGQVLARTPAALFPWRNQDQPSQAAGGWMPNQ